MSGNWDFDKCDTVRQWNPSAFTPSLCVIIYIPLLRENLIGRILCGSGVLKISGQFAMVTYGFITIQLVSSGCIWQVCFSEHWLPSSANDQCWSCSVFFIYLEKNWFSRVYFFCISLSIDLWWNLKKICVVSVFFFFFFFGIQLMISCYFSWELKPFISF